MANEKYTKGRWWKAENSNNVYADRLMPASSAQRAHVAHVLIAAEGASVLSAEELAANAHLIAAAPAQDIILELCRLGLGRFDSTTQEFCFGGLRVSACDGDWTIVINVLGWEKCRAAIRSAKGEVPNV
jgi:hypothetical protein